MNLSLGPLLYYWSRDDVLAFYDEAARWPVASVYLGESVCSRRHLLRLPDWLALAEELAAAGKEVALSTQTLIESESDLKTLRRIVADGRFAVEANEWGAVRLLSEAGVPFVAGPTLNVYNPETLDVLAGLGAQRWLPPAEMSRRPALKPRSSPTAACRWRIPRAASPRATTTCPRTTASSAASTIPTGWRWRRARASLSSPSTASRRSRPASTI